MCFCVYITKNAHEKNVFRFMPTTFGVKYVRLNINVFTKLKNINKHMNTLKIT